MRVMKKTAILFVGIIAMLCSCSKIETPAEEKTTLKINFTIGSESPQDDGSPETKAHKTAWANNDVVYILFDEGFSTGGYLKVKYNRSSSSWVVDEWSAGLEAKIAKKTGGQLCALYMPNDKVGGTIEFTNNNWTTCKVAAKDRMGNPFYSYWLEDKRVDYTVADGTLSADIILSRGGPNVVQFTIPNKDRNGNAINSDGSGRNLYKYKLRVAGGGTYIKSNTVTGWTGIGFLYAEEKDGWMSAYYYQKLMFSGASNLSNAFWKFYLTDGTNTYKYELSERDILYNQKTYNLPALNDTSKWIKQ